MSTLLTQEGKAEFPSKDLEAEEEMRRILEDPIGFDVRLVRALTHARACDSVTGTFKDFSSLVLFFLSLSLSKPR